MLSCRSTAFYSTFSFFFNHTAPTEIYTLSLHDALPIFLLCEVRQQRRLESLERIGLERLVAPVPPHFVRRGGLAHDELVVRAAPGMGGGYGGERPTLGDHALGATHRMLVELGWPEVPMDGALGREARGLQRGGPFAFGGTGGMRGHAFGSDRRVQARERRPCSCASTAAITAMFTISFA